MPDLSGMEDEAKNLASQHPDVADKGLEDAGKVAEDKTGGRFDSQIEQGEQQAEGFLGTGGQGGQDPQTGNQ